MNPLEALIVDDEPVAIRRLEQLLRAFEGITVAATATNADDALAAAERIGPDLVLLDIEMPGTDGIGLAGRLRALSPAPSIVFVTAYDAFALEAFDVAASDYLLKPVEPARLAEAIERVREKRRDRASAERVAELEQLLCQLRSAPRPPRSADRFLWLPSRNGRERVEIESILWLEAERDYVRIHTEDRSYFVRGRLIEFEKRLEGSGLVRVHRSALVQQAKIARVEPSGERSFRLILSDGTKIQASRRLRQSVRDIAFRST